MPQIVVAQRMWQRRDTAATWTAKNPVLAAGEIGVELGDTAAAPQKFKIGNGATPWNSLGYSNAEGSVRTIVGELGIGVDATDPINPKVRITQATRDRINASLLEVKPGLNILVDNTDPLRPIVSATEPDNPLYPAVTDQDGVPMTDQDGRPLRENTIAIPRSVLTGLGAMPVATLAQANAMTGVPDTATLMISDLTGGREPCWYDATVASGSKWRRFSDRSQAT